jgi:hypothetical protein
MSKKGEISMNRSIMPIGVILLLLGAVFIVVKLGMTIFGLFWPLLLLAGGWLLHKLYFRGHLPAIALAPGGLLVISSLPLLYGNWFGWESLKYLWPLFLFGAAIGIYEYYRYGRSNDRTLAVLAIALGIVSAVALSVSLFIKLSFIFVAIVLVVVGIVLIRRSK